MRHKKYTASIVFNTQNKEHISDNILYLILARKLTSHSVHIEINVFHCFDLFKNKNLSFIPRNFNNKRLNVHHVLCTSSNIKEKRPNLIQR